MIQPNMYDEKCTRFHAAGVRAKVRPGMQECHTKRVRLDTSVRCKSTVSTIAWQQFKI